MQLQAYKEHLPIACQDMADTVRHIGRDLGNTTASSNDTDELINARVQVISIQIIAVSCLEAAIIV